MRKLADILFNENSGDFSGAGTFQGGPYGFGNRHQLADSEIWPGLFDPKEDAITKSSMWPAVRAADSSDKNKYDSLESSEIYDDRPHLLPGEDTVRDQLLNEPEIEPSYFYEPINEDPARVLYRDLRGWPPMNTLSGPVVHVPDDEDPDREYPEEERYNIPKLLPSPREDDRGVPFGYGPVNEPAEGSLNLLPGDLGTQASMYDPMEPEGNELKLTQKRNQTLNRWKETTQVDKGHTNRDEVFNHLVKPVNWIKREWGQTNYKKTLDEPDDVPVAVGHAGVISNPVKHVPGPIDIYSKSTGYLKEEKNKMAKKSKKKYVPTPEELRKIVKYVPDELDKSSAEKTYGRGLGQILKQYDHYPKDFDAKDIKTFEPLAKEDPFIPYTYNPDKIVTIIQTKLIDKLAKKAKSSEK